MFAKILKASVILTVVMALVLAVAPATVSAAPLEQGGPGNRGGNGQGSGGGNGQGNGSGNGQGSGGANAGAGYALTPLNETEAQTLSQAILEEYGALNLYQSVIDQLGNVHPFSQVVLSEQQHLDALIRQADKYGVAVPANPGLTGETVFATLEDACEAGVAAEIADAALYDELAPQVNHPDILNVFSSLQSASLNNHLPAFEVCQ